MCLYINTILTYITDNVKSHFKFALQRAGGLNCSMSSSTFQFPVYEQRTLGRARMWAVKALMRLRRCTVSTEPSLLHIFSGIHKLHELLLTFVWLFIILCLWFWNKWLVWFTSTFQSKPYIYTCTHAYVLPITVLSANSDSDFMFCLQRYHGLFIDRSLVY